MAIKATRFTFTDYSFNATSREAVFSYQYDFDYLEPLLFQERITWPQTSAMRDVPDDVLHALLRNLHVGLGISYYKLYCPSTVSLTYALSPEEAMFWTIVYRKGLGEFWYQNKLDPDKHSPIFTGDASAVVGPYDLPARDRALVAIGGGKDSIVVAELLKKEGYAFSSFSVETQQTSPVIERVIDEIGADVLKITRRLDDKIFAKHPDSYNGHIPLSALIAWIGYVTAALFDFRYVVVGNEYSSSFGNLDYRGEEINHQWSKSIEFEQRMQSLTRRLCSPDITYFSLLRPFYELRIVELFTHFPQYRSLFSSCNRNFTVHRERPNTRWCGECPKCAFMFALLAAWLPKNDVISIFNKNLYADEALLGMYRDLLGLGNLKPFDCVGTFEETRAAFWLARDTFTDSVAITTFLPQLPDAEKLAEQVFRAQAAPTMPARFAFLGMKKALILGYGREGKVTEQYLRQTYPDLEIGIADQDNDPDYLARQSDYDIVVKTPGIPKKYVTAHYTTATNIFLSGISNLVIGVTGTKGKSTTAALIYSILQTAKRPVRLLGNIGTPMLEARLGTTNPAEIFVLELSSYQLDDIQFSPHIAVVLNLYRDHLDYHGDVAAYHEAKQNIIRYQRPRDYFVFNPNDEKLRSWQTMTPATAIPFSSDSPVGDDALPLVGRHNKENVLAAVTVARLLDIKDSVIARGITAFRPLPHRLEKVGTYRGITFYDDAISTTPESTIAALETFPDVKTIFLGGLDRGYDFSVLEQVLRDSAVENIVLFPDSGARILTDRTGFTVRETDSMREAVQFAYDVTPAGSVCLLSTASPSYSLWKNFEEQGEEFQRFVKELGR